MPEVTRPLQEYKCLKSLPGLPESSLEETNPNGLIAPSNENSAPKRKTAEPSQEEGPPKSKAELGSSQKYPISQRLVAVLKSVQTQLDEIKPIIRHQETLVESLPHFHSRKF